MKSLARYLGLLCLVVPVSRLPAQEHIGWVADVQTASALAAEQRRLVLLHFYSDNCGPCVALERNVFSQANVAHALSQNYVPVKVHAGKNPQLAARYRVNRWPTDVFVTSSGLEVYRTISPDNAGDYIAILNQVAQQTGIAASRQWQSPLDQVVRPAAAEAALEAGRAAGAVNAIAGQMQQSAAQGQQAAQQFQQQFRQEAAQVETQVQQNIAATRQDLSNAARHAAEQFGQTAGHTSQQFQQAAQGLGQQLQQAVAAQSFDRRSAFMPPDGLPPEASPAPSPPSPAPSPPAPPAAANNPWVTGNPLAASAAPPLVTPAQAPSAPAASPPVPAAPAASSVASQQPQQQLVLASQAPPICLDGFCPVTLLETMAREPNSRSAWKKGDKQFGAIHRGRTYLFASAEHQQRFLANPDAYAPALAGCDPVRFADRGEMIDGKRAYGLITPDRRIYLFADEASRNRFEQSPAGYSSAIQQAMLRTETSGVYR